jgi:hypothetical protein
VRLHERTTPAGRFLGERGRNTRGEDVVWVDYEAAVSIHRVRAADPRERRLERLASATAGDNRISYGCINVPAAFYDAHVRPVFAARPAMIYILPEVRSAREVFGPPPGGGRPTRHASPWDAPTWDAPPGTPSRVSGLPGNPSAFILHP